MILDRKTMAALCRGELTPAQAFAGAVETVSTRWAAEAPAIRASADPTMAALAASCDAEGLSACQRNHRRQVALRQWDLYRQARGPAA